MKVAALALLAAAPVAAQQRVAWDPAVDTAVLAGAAAVAGAAQLFESSLAPASCRACNPQLNAVDGWFHDALTGTVVSRRTADTASTVVALGALPLAAGAVALGAPEGERFHSLLVLAESAALSGAAVQAVKIAVARERPFARYGHGDASAAYDVGAVDAHLSFPSGHTAFAASLGFGAATLASIHHSPEAPWLWTGAAAATVATGALRMIAEKHYFTDVAAGALIGAASGVAVPLLHRRTSATMAAGPGSVSLSLAF